MAELLNHLGHLALEVRTKGELTQSWVVLINVYFRGDDPIGQIKKWAESERLHASFNYSEDSYHTRVVESVTFSPFSLTK
jgi:hypothetical protein